MELGLRGKGEAQPRWRRLVRRNADSVLSYQQSCTSRWIGTARQFLSDARRTAGSETDRLAANLFQHISCSEGVWPDSVGDAAPLGSPVDARRDCHLAATHCKLP